MPYDPEKLCRRSLRLKGYDYSSVGAYFITICVQNRHCLLGEILAGKMDLSHAGRMAVKWWEQLEKKFENVKTDEFVVMPNHVHGIIQIVACRGGHTDPPNKGLSLHEITQWFKTMTTNEYIRNVKTQGWPPVKSRLWQRNYYDHIIRNDDDLNRVRQYIRDNPMSWADDAENPANP